MGFSMQLTASYTRIAVNFLPITEDMENFVTETTYQISMFLWELGEKNKLTPGTTHTVLTKRVQGPEFSRNLKVNIWLTKKEKPYQAFYQPPFIRSNGKGTLTLVISPEFIKEHKPHNFDRITFYEYMYDLLYHELTHAMDKELKPQLQSLFQSSPSKNVIKEHETLDYQQKAEREYYLSPPEIRANANQLKRYMLLPGGKEARFNHWIKTEGADFWKYLQQDEELKRKFLEYVFSEDPYEVRRDIFY